MRNDPALYFGPQEIRDHFEGNDDPIAKWVEQATDNALIDIGGTALYDDRLYRAFHDSLVDAVQEQMES